MIGCDIMENIITSGHVYGDHSPQEEDFIKHMIFKHIRPGRDNEGLYYDSRLFQEFIYPLSITNAAISHGFVDNTINDEVRHYGLYTLSTHYQMNAHPLESQYGLTIEYVSSGKHQYPHFGEYEITAVQQDFRNKIAVKDVNQYYILEATVTAQNFTSIENIYDLLTRHMINHPECEFVKNFMNSVGDYMYSDIMYQGIMGALTWGDWNWIEQLISVAFKLFKDNTIRNECVKKIIDIINECNDSLTLANPETMPRILHLFSKCGYLPSNDDTVDDIQL